MRPAPWLLALACALPGGVRAAEPGEPEIRAQGGEVTIRAHNLPLFQILDRLSSATGMDLTYEGSRPSNPVTVSVDGISEVAAVLQLMEGLGVSYVFRTDASGQRVDLLIVSGSAGGGGAPRVAAAAAASAAPGETWEEPVADYGHIPLDPAVVEATGGAGKPDFNNPYLGLPTQHFPQAAPGQYTPPDPTGSAQGGGRNTPPPPAFPRAASYPTR